MVDLNKITTNNTSFEELLEICKKQQRMIDKIVKSNDSKSKKLMDLKNRYEKMAYIDQLTEIYNRRYFFEYLDYIIPLVRVERSNLSFAMIDIDKFKNINDTYGHDVGDIVIKSLVKNVNSVIKDKAIFSRVGGEEFIIIFPNSSLQDTIPICENIRKEVENSSPYKDIKFTISIGVSEFDLENDDIDTIIKKIDNLLYKAKEGGRNKIKWS